MDSNAPLEQSAPSAPHFSSEGQDQIANKKSHNKTIIILLSIFAVIATATAVVFGVMYFTNQKPTDQPTPETSVQEEETERAAEEKTSREIDSEIAQNIINPYIKDFHAFYNILDFNFDETAKAELAFLNISPSMVFPTSTADSTAVSFKISYYSLNDKYQQLFGSMVALAKQNYSSNNTSSMEYDATTDDFIVSTHGSGGTAMTMFSIAKRAYIEGENLNIEVYHDRIPLCDANPNDGYCFNAGDLPLTSQSPVIQNFSEQIPVYTMAFTKENGHYILTNIQK